MTFTRLDVLKINACPIGDQGLEALCDSDLFARTTELNLSSCELTTLGIMDLLACPHIDHITALDLKGNAIDFDGLVALLHANLPHLDTLTLERNDLSHVPERYTRGGHSESSHSGPRRLTLRQCQLTSQGMRWLMSWGGLRDVERLNLSRNAIGDDGACALAHSPHLNPSLHINLEQNAIGDNSTLEIGVSSMIHTSMTLKLSFNKRIRALGALALSESPVLDDWARRSWRNLSDRLT